MTTAVAVGSCFMRRATSSRMALAMLVRRAEPGSKWISSVRISVGAFGGVTGGGSGGGPGGGTGGGGGGGGGASRGRARGGRRWGEVRGAGWRFPLGGEGRPGGEGPAGPMQSAAEVGVAAGDAALRVAGWQIGEERCGRRAEAELGGQAEIAGAAVAE